MKRWYVIRKRLTLFRMKHLINRLTNWDGLPKILPQWAVCTWIGQPTISSNPSGTGSGIVGTALSIGSPCDRHYPNLFLDCPGDIGSDSLCHQRIRWLSGDTDPMDNKVHFRLPVASCFRPVQFHSCPNTGAYVTKGYSGTIRPQFHTGQK